MQGTLRSAAHALQRSRTHPARSLLLTSQFVLTLEVGFEAATLVSDALSTVRQDGYRQLSIPRFANRFHSEPGAERDKRFRFDAVLRQESQFPLLGKGGQHKDHFL